MIQSEGNSQKTYSKAVPYVVKKCYVKEENSIFKRPKRPQLRAADPDKGVGLPLTLHSKNPKDVLREVNEVRRPRAAKSPTGLGGPQQTIAD